MQKIRYTLAIHDPAAHLFESSIELPDHEGGDLHLFMPTWIPGSYLIRDFSRFIEAAFAEQDGQPLEVSQSTKNRWTVHDAKPGPVKMSLHIMANDLQLRGAYVGRGGMFANGTHVFPCPVGQTERPSTVRIDAPDDWQVSIALPESDGLYHARNYDQLVDSPLHAGHPERVDFEAAGLPHQLVIVGRGAPAATELVDGFRAIVENHAERFGPPPYERYVFMVLVSDRRGGGLEHASSCVLGVDRTTFADDDGRFAFWSLVAHEHLHAWNVKALRPAELVPFDYEREQRTPSLWVAEGWTDYLCELSIRQTGLATRKQFLTDWGKRLARLEATPGRRVESLADASRNAWIKLYRPHHGLRNITVSYYLKGSVVAWLLDLELRRRTDGRANLDLLLRRLVERYPVKAGGLPEDGVRVQAAQLLEDMGVDPDLGPLLDAWVDGTDDLPLNEALLAFGLKRAPKTAKGAGIQVRLRSGGLVLDFVERGGIGQRAGLEPGDELVAWNDAKLTESLWNKRLKGARPGDSVRLHIFRRGLLREVQLTLGDPPPGELRLKPIGKSSDGQRQLLAAWAGAEDPKKPDESDSNDAGGIA